MRKPHGEFLRELGAARTRTTDRDEAADELMRLADDPLLLGSLIRGNETSRAWSTEKTKVPLLGLALLGAAGKGAFVRNGYQALEALQPPSLTPETFDPDGEDWDKTLDIPPLAGRASPAAWGKLRWNMTVITAMLFLGILLLRW